VGEDSSGRPVIQLLNPAKVGRRWGMYLRYRLPADTEITIKWWTKKVAGAFTPAGDMSPSGLSIKKLSIVVYNYATLFRLCQEQKKNRNNP